ncbi:uncharacterized protein BcabD6B2_00530 [Babesia caballi]|uniref:Uncharacterized protein n=1 Tax=Babesia caballi TaxID=5871 RepID=A0AAV4LLT4_BABCB|nr:hypothetical protein BcabD6B2_00530 [Babesia caballi]
MLNGFGSEGAAEPKANPVVPNGGGSKPEDVAWVGAKPDTGPNPVEVEVVEVGLKPWKVPPPKMPGLGDAEAGGSSMGRGSFSRKGVPAVSGPVPAGYSKSGSNISWREAKLSSLVRTTVLDVWNLLVSFCSAALSVVTDLNRKLDLLRGSQRFWHPLEDVAEGRGAARKQQLGNVHQKAVAPKLGLVRRAVDQHVEHLVEVGVVVPLQVHLAFRVPQAGVLVHGLVALHELVQAGVQQAAVLRDVELLVLAQELVGVYQEADADLEALDVGAVLRAVLDGEVLPDAAEAVAEEVVHVQVGKALGHQVGLAHEVSVHEVAQDVEDRASAPDGRPRLLGLEDAAGVGALEAF